jgi:hypothetical protein
MADKNITCLFNAATWKSHKLPYGTTSLKAIFDSQGLAKLQDTVGELGTDDDKDMFTSSKRSAESIIAAFESKKPKISMLAAELATDINAEINKHKDEVTNIALLQTKMAAATKDKNKKAKDAAMAEIDDYILKTTTKVRQDFEKETPQLDATWLRRAMMRIKDMTVAIKTITVDQDA